MEETVIVVMLKNTDNGFLEKEIGCYKIPENENYITNTYAMPSEDGYIIHIKLSLDKDVLDWEYNAIYDYYDTEVIHQLPFVVAISEESDSYNPTWNVSFRHDESNEYMEACFQELLSCHKNELLSVYEAIKDKENDYLGE